MSSALYSPGNIGRLEVKNRFIMTAMHTALSDNGVVNPAVIEYFRPRARGGAGLLVVGAVGLDPLRINTRDMLQLYDDSFVSGMGELSDMIHAEGSRCFVQLMHPGRYARSGEYNGQQAVAPSAVPSRFTGETPRELGTDEIADIIDFYAAAAARAREAGFDGVEITAASGYLPAQFLSPVTNLRTDRYGGSPEARRSFLLELIAAVRQAAGEDFPLMIRVGGNDFVPGGNRNDDAVEICRVVEAAGADAINMTGGWHETAVPQLTMDVPHGAFSYLARRIKGSVGIPVCVCNRMDVQTAEKLMDRGEADFIGFARSFLADPFFPSKAERGDYDQIRPCIACNQGCMDHIFYGKSINCLVNYEAGREAAMISGGQLATEKRGLFSEKILVVGAGPAGMEFARLAASRGHRVTIREKGGRTGGQMLLAGAAAGRGEVLRFERYLRRSCERLGVKIELHTEAAAEEIIEEVRAGVFDRVVIATGKRPTAAHIKSDGSIPVLHAWNLLGGRSETRDDKTNGPATAGADTPFRGRRIIIAGGRAQGVWTALTLTRAGTLSAEQLEFPMLHKAEDPLQLNELLSSSSREITIVENSPKIGRDIGPSTRWSTIMMLKKYGIGIAAETELIEIRKGQVFLKDQDGTRGEKADTIVLTGPFEKNDGLFEELRGRIGKLNKIGDAAGIGNMMEAVKSAYQLVARIGGTDER